MNAVKSITAAVAAQLALLGGAAAQEPAPAQRSDTVFFIANGAAPIMPLGGRVDVIAGSGSVTGEVIEGKPYSAESVTESTQMLADGNRITTTNRARVYRDSAGRTRREQQLDAVGVWQADEPVSMVTINDPTRNVTYFIDSRTETVRELTPFRLERTLEGAAQPAEPGPAPRMVIGAPPEPSAAGGGESRADEPAAGAGVAADRGVQHFRLARPPANVALASPVFGTIASAGGPVGAPVTESLGEQVLEGVLARGTRVTHTIAAGAIGNELPIEIVREEWYSPDIEAIVLSRNFDPRFGETSYRLINVDRSEPPPELFTIPQDYEVMSSDAGPAALPPLPARVTLGTRGQQFERRVMVVQPNPAAAQE